MKFSINNILLLQLLFLSLSGITAWQKISALIVPEWFLKKFEHSFFGMIPLGIPLAFYTIIVLETAVAIAFIISLLKMEFRNNASRNWLCLGLDLSMLLFLILFFGSFLVSDYSNGALDFMYFGFSFFMKREFSKESKENAG
jgi:hypothetical protein